MATQATPSHEAPVPAGTTLADDHLRPAVPPCAVPPAGRAALRPEILTGAETNRLVLADAATRFGPAGESPWPADAVAAGALPARDPLADPAAADAILARLDRALAAALAAWRPGAVRFQPATGMVLARGLVCAVTGLAPGSGPAERLASALATLEEAPGLLRRSILRGLPSSAFGARRALAQGLEASGAAAHAGVLQAAQRLAGAMLASLAAQLVANPDWQDTLRAETRSLAGGAGRPLAPAQLARLDLVDMALDEALRLMPGAPLVLRRVLAPVDLEGRHFTAGSLVALSPDATHRDPALWPDPARFDPLRFAAGARAARDAGAWIPPGVGLRAGPEQRLARHAAQLVVHHLLDRHRLEGPASVAWRAGVPARARDGLKLVLRASE